MLMLVVGTTTGLRKPEAVVHHHPSPMNLRLMKDSVVSVVNSIQSQLYSNFDERKPKEANKVHPIASTIAIWIVGEALFLINRNFGPRVSQWSRQFWKRAKKRGGIFHKKSYQNLEGITTAWRQSGLPRRHQWGVGMLVGSLVAVVVTPCCWTSMGGFYLSIEVYHLVRKSLRQGSVELPPDVAELILYIDANIEFVRAWIRYYSTLVIEAGQREPLIQGVLVGLLWGGIHRADQQ